MINVKEKTSTVGKYITLPAVKRIRAIAEVLKVILALMHQIHWWCKEECLLEI